MLGELALQVTCLLFCILVAVFYNLVLIWLLVWPSLLMIASLLVVVLRGQVVLVVARHLHLG